MNTIFRRSTKNSPYEVLFAMTPNGIPKFLGEAGIETTEFREEFGLSAQTTEDENQIDPAVTIPHHADFSCHISEDHPDKENGGLKVTSPKRKQVRDEVLYFGINQIVKLQKCCIRLHTFLNYNSHTNVFFR